MSSLSSFPSDISEAEQKLHELSNLKKQCITAINPDNKDDIPKIVWKYDVFMQACIYRFTDIASVAIDAWKQSKHVPAAILARSMMETASASYWLLIKAKKALINNDMQTLDENIMNLLFVAKIVDDLGKAQSIMNFIDTADKLLPNFRKVYDILSELSHPNNMGTKYAYSITNQHQRTVTFFDIHPEAQSRLSIDMASSFSGSVFLLKHSYEQYLILRYELISATRKI